MKDLYKSIPHSDMDKLAMRWPDLVEPVKEFKKEVHDMMIPKPHKVHHNDGAVHKTHHQPQGHWDFLFPFAAQQHHKTEQVPATHHKKAHHSPFEFLFPQPVHREWNKQVQSIKNFKLF